MSSPSEEEMTNEEESQEQTTDEIQCSTNKKDSGKPPLAPRKKMKSRSEVWEHFEVFEENGERKAKCKYCPKRYSCDSKKCGTSTLKTHMTSCIYSPLKKNSNQSELTLKPNVDSEVVSFSNWKFDQVLARRKLVEMIIKDEFAFSVVDGEGFIEFIGVICPRFKIPSRWTISRDIYQLFLDEKTKLRDFFKSSRVTVCLTTDGWTSMQRVNYMCITAHYVDTNWNLNKKIITFCLIESHKGEDMSRQIDGCLREWGIARVLAITVDNATANDSCIDYLKDRLTNRGCDVVKGEHLHMRCAAHVLNLIVSDGLKVINPSIKRVRDAVRFVRHSPARLARFKECCLEENIDCTSLLCLDVPTRWNSTYLMLSVAIKFQMAFDRFEVEDPHYRKTLSGKDASGVPTLSDWNVVKKICDVLLVFYELTLKVSASLHVTSHLIYQEIDGIGNLLKDLIADTLDTNCPYIKEMGVVMQLKFNKYWGDAATMNKLIHLGHILDPRYKFKYISVLFKEDYGDEEGLKLLNGLKIALQKLFEHYTCFIQSQSTSVDSSQSQSQSTSMDSTLSIGPPKKKARYSGRLELIKQLEAQSGEIVNKTELDIYLNEETLKCEDQDFKILKWWEVHQGRFPILSHLARDVLAMPISTVPSESAFSTGGRILDPFRSSLTPKIVESLICAQNWLRRSKNSIMVFEEDLASLMMHEEGIQNIGTKESDKGKSKEMES